MRRAGYSCHGMTLSVAIYLFDDVEVLDFAGPYEVFTTASRVHLRRHPVAAPPFEVFTVSSTGTRIRARAGLVVQPDHAFDAHPAIDVLIVPGGVVDAELLLPATRDWILGCSASSRMTASVCTGAFLLAEAGILNGKEATTHWEDIAALRANYPAVSVVEGRHWVDQGSVVSSAGISAGIHMSLHLVERLATRELAEATARQMEFDWCGEA